MTKITDSHPIQLSLVIPTYNEVGNVVELTERVRKTLTNIQWELIFVDDDSPDDTAEVVREIARTDSRIRCLQRIGRRGLSSACIEGMLATSGLAIAVMDADLQHDETILPQMLSKIEDKGAELVIGTRYSAGGGTGNWSESRKKISLFATKISALVIKQDVSDPMSGFFMIQRKVLDKTVRNLSGIGFKILLDILATAKGTFSKIDEVPYQFRSRFAGDSKLDEMVIWEFGMLMADKTIGQYIPVRFITFSLIGGIGVFIHMAILTTFLKGVGASFVVAQTVATIISMIFNFALNNILTYRDQRLKGLGWFKGLVSFMICCSIGALSNVGIATYLFRSSQTQWFLAAITGVVVGAVWNYAITQLYTWKK